MAEQQHCSLSQADISTFERDGVVCLRGVIDQDWIATLREAVDREIANPGPNHYGYEGDSGGFHGNQDLWLEDEAFRAYCLGSPLPGLAAGLLGASRVQLYFDHLFVKEPGALSPTPWHNDQPYWPIAGRGIISFWAGLDSVDRTSGAVEYIRGSHQWDRWFQPRGFADSKTGKTSYAQNPDYEPLPDFDAERGLHDIVAFDVEPGDVIAFHGLTVHGAGGNRSADRRRRGYAVRYIGDDVRYDPRIGTSKLLWKDSEQAGAPLSERLYPVVWQQA